MIRSFTSNQNFVIMSDGPNLFRVNDPLTYFVNACMHLSMNVARSLVAARNLHVRSNTEGNARSLSTSLNNQTIHVSSALVQTPRIGVSAAAINC